jgi:hypothetical protein
MVDTEPIRGKLEFSRLFDYTVRGGAVLLGVIYVTGFLIVSFNSARFGILESGFLRPHILAAGVLFLILTVVPSYAAISLCRPEWLPIRSGVAVPNERPIQRRTLRFINQITVYYFICFGLALVSDIVLFEPLFQNPQFERGMSLLWYGFILGIIVAISARFYFDRAWFLFVGVNACLSAFFLWVAYHYFGRPFSTLSLWYFGVGLAALYMAHGIRIQWLRAAIQWEQVPFFLLTIVTMYSGFVYRELRPELGGGAPRSATLHFSAKTPLSETDSAEVSLIEEADAGFYVLLKPDDSVAYYVRRDLVTVIKYHQEKEGR